jgi:HK97 family phage prohead protease
MATAVTVGFDEIASKRSDEVRGEAVVKAFRGPASWDDVKRTARFTMSTQAEDRYGDVVEIAGMDIEQFLKNPVAPLAHASWDWPIGKWTDLEKNLTGRPKRLDGTLNLLPEGEYDQADLAARMIKHGIMRACSVGFIPKQTEIIRDEEGRWLGFRFLESELIECSLVAIPANAQALVKAMGGDERDTKLTKSLIEMVLDDWCRTPDGVLIPREQFEKDYRVAKAASEIKGVSFELPEGVDAEALKQSFKSFIVTGSGRTIGVEGDGAADSDPVEKAIDDAAEPVIEITDADIEMAAKAAVTVTPARNDAGDIVSVSVTVDESKAIESALAAGVERALKDTAEDKRSGVIARWLKSLFVSDKEETVERVEPHFEPPEVKTIPGSALEARAKAVALRARLREKALI